MLRLTTTKYPASRAMLRYMYLTGRVNMKSIEVTIQNLIGSGMDPKTENNPYLGFCYTSFQERATKVRGQGLLQGVGKSAVGGARPLKQGGMWRSESSRGARSKAASGAGNWKGTWGRVAKGGKRWFNARVPGGMPQRSPPNVVCVASPLAALQSADPPASRPCS